MLFSDKTVTLVLVRVWTNLVEVFEPSEPERLHGVRYASLLMPHHLHQPRDAHAEDSTHPGRPRGIGQVDLAGPFAAVPFVADVIGRSNVANFGEDQILKGGFLLPPPVFACFL